MTGHQFSSRLKEDMEGLLEQKHALGSPYIVSGRILLEFDRFCQKHFPDAETITPELAMAWAVIKPTEKPESFRNRMAPVRELARYMARRGRGAMGKAIAAGRTTRDRPKAGPAPYAAYIYHG